MSVQLTAGGSRVRRVVRALASLALGSATATGMTVSVHPGQGRLTLVRLLAAFAGMALVTVAVYNLLAQWHALRARATRSDGPG